MACGSKIFATKKAGRVMIDPAGFFVAIQR
jgi:hypothetical protein